MEDEVLNNNRRKELKLLVLLYFIAAFIEVMAEFYAEDFYIYLSKPLLLPILSVVYWKSSSKKDNLFLMSFFFAFLANIFFISKDFNSILIGAIFYSFYRMIVIYIVVKSVKIKNYLPIVLGAIPFIVVFTYITTLTIDELGKGLYIYTMQVILMIFLGGFSLANYIVDKNKMNYWLLISCLLFTVIQFVFIIKLYYISIYIFQPLAMILYTFAQYTLYKYVILSEEKSLDNNTLSS